ncbi:acyl-CoA dehydrogenase family protein [Brevibacillus humidisoli]|uniref:acyl-CoA dehydrogenase family protein n=1 Tax=Brevibacillus humidisoli TaxID=2895522 RepID=UPI001E468626|nr:acyl-CoA dehydrogenase family protein [Brevibacillus humidisoli]UFJ42480.1 acyl-CoA dehydrogenase family protein [Brevibacillus humidisoli]
MNVELLQEWLRPYANGLRELALVGDTGGGQLEVLFRDPFFAPLHRLKTPAKYWEGIRLRDGTTLYGTSSVENVCIAEELAYGDPGLYLALPGPNLAGTVVDKLGTPEQKDAFFQHFLHKTAWSAFALTEPDAGSDAAAIATTAMPQPDGSYLLNGAKRYIGNGMSADWYVVFAQTRPSHSKRSASVLTIESFLFRADECTTGLIRSYDRTVGLRAARLGRIGFQNLRLTPEHVLGYDKKPLNRGFTGAIATFQLMRPATAAMAVGIARAAIEYTEASKRLTPHEEIVLSRLKWEVKRGRLLAMHAANLCDQGAGKARYYASMAKCFMNRLVAETTRNCSAMFGSDLRSDHPFLEKLQRDSWMIEYMEGTSNILTLDVHSGLLANGQLPTTVWTGGNRS